MLPLSSTGPWYWHGPRADPAVRTAWEKYYLARGVGLFKAHALARKKSGVGLRPPSS